MTTQLQDVTGFRGEKIAELALTDYSEFPKPLFQPGFLGDKWPAIDFYVELTAVPGKRPYFFVQTKATKSKLTKRSTHLSVSTKKTDIQRRCGFQGRPTFSVSTSHQRGYSYGRYTRVYREEPSRGFLSPTN
jgi:hypothetical protein